MSENSPCSEEPSVDERSGDGRSADEHTTEGCSTEERDLAGYIDELIAAALRRHRPEATAYEPVPEATTDEKPEAKTVPEPIEATTPTTPEPAQEAAAAHSGAPEAAGARREPASGRKRARATSQAALHEEFLALFRPTELWPPPPLPGRAYGSAITAAETESPATPPSKFFRRFLEQTARPPEPAPSGLANLDARLAGGFAPGLHLVSGTPQVGKTAFVESVAWEAVSSGSPVLYYAFKEGSTRAWERLISTLGVLLAGPAISLDTIRSPAISPEDLDNVARLDLALQDLVLPWLSLVDSTSARSDSLNALMADVRARTQGITERHGRIPLVLVDDLERLLLLCGARSLVPTLSLLEDVFAADRIPCLLTMTTSEETARRLARLPARTTMVLVPLSTFRNGFAGNINLELLRNAQTGWMGTLPLVLDRRSGLFTHPS